MLSGRNNEQKVKSLNVLSYEEREGFIGRSLLVVFDERPGETISPRGFDRQITVSDIEKTAQGTYRCKLNPQQGDTIEDLIVDIIILKEFYTQPNT